MDTSVVCIQAHQCLLWTWVNTVNTDYCKTVGAKNLLLQILGGALDYEQSLVLIRVAILSQQK